MNYSNEFRSFVKSCLNEKTYVGIGNPNSKILIVGKEVAINQEKVKAGDLFEIKNMQNYNQNAQSWMENINNNVCQEDIPNWSCPDYLNDEFALNNPLHSFKSVTLKEHKEGQTFRKYQKLYNYIFGKVIDLNSEYDFQNNIFLTELNDSPSHNTRIAKKESIAKRKELFKNSPFIQSFQVVILACSNYIKNVGVGMEREIDDVFNVTFSHKNCEHKFWVHFNESNTKIVIHTRQLSANVSNDFLKAIASEIAKFLKLDIDNSVSSDVM